MPARNRLANINLTAPFWECVPIGRQQDESRYEHIEQAPGSSYSPDGMLWLEHLGREYHPTPNADGPTRLGTTGEGAAGSQR